MTRFRPERPIFLNESLLGVKTRDQALLKIEQLRSAGWLATYSEQDRPYFSSFSEEKTLNEFKKCCKDLDIKIGSPKMASDDLDLLLAKDKEIVKEEAKSSHESPDGVIHIES